ncbi:MAG: porin family protein [Fermentimonas sp.]|nr:porin family protein [Fermentimonas sp.]
MKRIIFIFLALTVVTSNNLFAQREIFQGEFYFGAGAGPSITSIDFQPSVPQAQKIGLSGGVALKYISQKNLGLVVEANYSQRGWEEEFDPESDFSYNRTLNYLEIPFMTHVYFGNKTRFIINAGPQISFLLSDSQEMSQALASDLEARREANPDLRIGYQYGPFSEMQRVDYGLIGGIGIELQTGIGNFDLEGRYYFGLGDIFTSRRSENAYFGRSAHRLIEGKLTYYIKFR